MAAHAVYFQNSRVFVYGGIALLIGLGIALCGRAIARQVEHYNVSFDVSPKGNQLAFAAADGNLYLLDLKTMKVTPFVNSSGQQANDVNSAPAFSPDTAMIAYASGTGKKEGKHLFLRSLDGKTTRQLTTAANVHDSSPVFSADGKQVAFARAALYRPYSMGGWKWDHWDLWVINTDGTGLKRITNQNYYELSYPLFLPDGKQIVYHVYENSVMALCRVAVQPGAKPQPFGGRPGAGQKIGSWGSDPCISRDGTQVAFVSDRGAPYMYDIWLMSNAKPGMKTSERGLGVTSVSDFNQHPVFRPDGKSLLFLAGRESNASNRPIFSLWQVTLQTKATHQIADSGLFTDPLHWKPGKAVAVDKSTH